MGEFREILRERRDKMRNDSKINCDRNIGGVNMSCRNCEHGTISGDSIQCAELAKALELCGNTPPYMYIPLSLDFSCSLYEPEALDRSVSVAIVGKYIGDMFGGYYINDGGKLSYIVTDRVRDYIPKEEK